MECIRICKYCYLFDTGRSESFAFCCNGKSKFFGLRVKFVSKR